jgi:hypothetical protein
MGFLTRREDVELEAFVDYYENHHAKLITSFDGGPPGYKRNYLQHDHELNQVDSPVGFDVVVELTFPDRAAWDAWAAKVFAPSNLEQIRADEAKIFARPPRLYVVEEKVTSVIGAEG